MDGPSSNRLPRVDSGQAVPQDVQFAFQVLALLRQSLNPIVVASQAGHVHVINRPNPLDAEVAAMNQSAQVIEAYLSERVGIRLQEMPGDE